MSKTPPPFAAEGPPTPPPAGQKDATPEVDLAPPRNAFVRFWLSARSIVVLVVVLFAVRSSIADWNDVPTGSMIPTILDGDRIFVNKLAYDLKIPFTTVHVGTWSGPKNGDIVVFFSPDDGTRLVKRCVAIPGDTIEVVQDHLIINGTMIAYGPPDPKILATRTPKDLSSFNYETETLGLHTHPIQTFKSADYFRASHRDYGPIKVPPGKYFMMGDNRDNSRDSRYFTAGPFVDRNAIVGKATAVAVSVDLQNYWMPRWSRFFSKLP